MKTMQDFELGQTVVSTYRLQVDIFKGCIPNIIPNVTAKLPFPVFNGIERQGIWMDTISYILAILILWDLDVGLIILNQTVKCVRVLHGHRLCLWLLQTFDRADAETREQEVINVLPVSAALS